MTVRVKICGVTRVEDALLAADLGADAIGVNLWPGSRRHVAPEQARAIVEALPPFVTAVGVFVNQSVEEICGLVGRTGVAAVQLHGDEPPAACGGHPVPVLKALRVDGPGALDQLDRYAVCGFVLDAPSDGYGGSGVTFDWAVARTAAQRARVVLAGGLTPDNVAAAIRAVAPWGVDVASGVEASPGVKDPDKLARFIARAKEVR